VTEQWVPQFGASCCRAPVRRTTWDGWTHQLGHLDPLTALAAVPRPPETGAMMTLAQTVEVTEALIAAAEDR
jgi:hypothetical protein